MKQNLLFFFLLSLILFTACTKIITTNIGGGLLPPSDAVITKDTFITVSTKNAGDSVIRPFLSNDHVVGVVNDPLFGQVNAKVNLQLIPSYFPYAYEVSSDSLTLDSLVLILHFNGVWGDSTKPVPLHVYQIASDQPFTVDSNYSTGVNFLTQREVTYNNSPVNVYTPGLLTDSFHVFQDSGVASIRIRLSDDIGNLLLNQFGTTQFQSDSIFNIYFRGLQISADPTANSLIKLGLTDAGTKLGIYYKYIDPDSTNGHIDTTVRYFTTESGLTAHSNNITRNRAGSQFGSLYPNPPTNTASDSLLYIEANPGNFVNVTIPGLTGFPNVLIHRAELLLSSEPDFSDQYLSPPVLMLAGYFTDSMRRIALLSDLLDVSGNVSLAAFGSLPEPHYNPPTGTNYYTYTFNISRYVQGILSRGDTNYTKLALYAPFYNEYLYASQSSTSPFSISTVELNPPACGRIRLAGGNVADTTKRMRLHIVYSILK